MTKKLEPTQCLHCGKTYWHERSYQKYCSPQCRRAAEPFYQNRILFNKRCLVCDLDFSTYNHRQKYCSHECYLKANRAATLQYRKKTTSPFLRIRFQVFERDKFRCKYCGRGPDDGVKLTVDHITPQSKGGANELSNYITTCSDCNQGKGDILLLANKKGQIPSFIRLKEKA